MSAASGTVRAMKATEPSIPDLAAAVKQSLRAGGDTAALAGRVGDVVGAYQPSPELLTLSQRHGTPGRVAGHLLHAEEDFSLLALVWRPGQQTSIHDHRCWCVVYVVDGSEQETRYVDHGDFLVESRRTRNPAASVSALTPPGDIHRIRNDTDRTTISLHVYGIDLRVAGSSARRRYDTPVRELPANRRDVTTGFVSGLSRRATTPGPDGIIVALSEKLA